MQSFFSYSCLQGMGWLRLVGSLQLYVSFAKKPYKRDDILQKGRRIKEPANRSHPIMRMWIGKQNTRLHIAVSTENAPPKSTKSRKSDFSGVSRYTFKMRCGFEMWIYKHTHTHTSF